jgi:hypothetical protein
MPAQAGFSDLSSAWMLSPFPHLPFKADFMIGRAQIMFISAF